MTRSRIEHRHAQPPRVPSVARSVVCPVAAADDDVHDVARLVAPERVGHGLQVGHVHVADPGDDVIAPESRLLGRAAGRTPTSRTPPGLSVMSGTVPR